MDLCRCTVEVWSDLNAALVRQRLRAQKVADSARAEVSSRDFEQIIPLLPTTAFIRSNVPIGFHRYFRHGDPTRSN